MTSVADGASQVGHLVKRAGASRSPWHVKLAVLTLIAIGVGLTVWTFYPGVMSYDARFVYNDLKYGYVGDWQSPVMGAVWALIDPIAPGSASMFLLIIGLYWLAFAILALAVARRSPRLGLLLPVLALSPPAFLFVGAIWRDVLMAGIWLLAAALAFAAGDRQVRFRLPVQLVALVLVGFGVLMRPNALLAAPVLAAYILWPTRFELKRAILLYVPALVVGFGLMQVVYYGVLHAQRQNLMHTILVFDLGGMTYFTQENQFPVAWSNDEMKLLKKGCYDASQWDTYWWLNPCQFVMTRLETEDVFGRPALIKAWTSAVLHHPIAYLRHRAAHSLAFLTKNNSSTYLRVLDIDDGPPLYADNPAYRVAFSVSELLESTLMFRTGTWFVAVLLIVALAWKVRLSPAGAFAIGVSGSAVFYMATFFIVGVATAFRYGYWAVVATLTSAVVLMLARQREPRRGGARSPSTGQSDRREGLASIEAPPS